ncbi:MAG: DMT family transporter [Alphaproteobacteria bacterium]|nr:DMT family transporter [Alphaproteobacteria bacterium]
MKPARHPKALLGIALMLLAMLTFPFLDVLAKKLGQQGLPAMEATWARTFLGSLLCVPLLLATEGSKVLRPRDNGLNAARGLAIVLTTFFFFSALRFQSVADTLSIYFIQPILVMALAPLLLREKISWHRWAAVFAGFLGVLIIIRPGLVAFNPGTVLSLGSGLAAAAVVLLSRKLAGGSSALANTFYSSLYGAALASLVMLWQWHSPTPTQWAMMFGIGALGIICNFLIIKAFEWCEASLLAPFGYAEMINAVTAGWFFFGDFPDAWTFVGLAILIGAALFVSQREHRAAPEESPAQV